jgi:hypothetical protein
VAAGLGVRARVTGGRPCRVAAGLGLEPESGSRSGTTQQVGSVRQREKGEGKEKHAARADWAREGGVGRARWRKRREGARLGLAGEEKERKKAS